MSDDNLVTLYHGTSTRHLSSIQMEGLQPGRADGLDDGLVKEGDKDLAERNKHRVRAVYVTTSASRAMCFAGYVAEQHGAEPVLLELAIPEEMFCERFVVDEICEQPILSREDFRTEQPIPPKLIADVTVLDGLDV